MYVKTEMKQAAEDGGARLRIRYIDKNGKWIYLDSEILKETTGGFVCLYRTFTVPSDSKDPTVRVYLYLYHAAGVLYGDMAQLETGTTVSRCNLIDNGDFQLGSTDFEKKAYYEDGLTSVGSENVRPVNRAVTVTAAGTSYIYDRPSLNGKKSQVYRNGHIFMLLFPFQMKTASGTGWKMQKENGDIFRQAEHLHTLAEMMEIIVGQLRLQEQFCGLQLPTVELL